MPALTGNAMRGEEVKSWTCKKKSCCLFNSPLSSNKPLEREPFILPSLGTTSELAGVPVELQSLA